MLNQFVSIIEQVDPEREKKEGEGEVQDNGTPPPSTSGDGPAAATLDGKAVDGYTTTAAADRRTASAADRTALASAAARRGESAPVPQAAVASPFTAAAAASGTRTASMLPAAGGGSFDPDGTAADTPVGGARSASGDRLLVATGAGSRRDSSVAPAGSSAHDDAAAAAAAPSTGIMASAPSRERTVTPPPLPPPAPSTGAGGAGAVLSAIYETVGGGGGGGGGRSGAGREDAAAVPPLPPVPETLTQLVLRVLDGDTVAARHRKTQRDLHDAVDEFAGYKKRVVACFEAYQAVMERWVDPPIDGDAARADPAGFSGSDDALYTSRSDGALPAARAADIAELRAMLKEIREAELPAAVAGAENAASWYATVRDDVTTDASGGSILEDMVTHLQDALTTAEQHAQDLRGRIREAEAAVAAADAAAATTAPTPSASAAGGPHVVIDVDQRPADKPWDAGDGDGGAHSPSRADAASSEAFEALKRRLTRAQSDLGEKQAAMSVLYNEKEDLQARLQQAVAKLALAHTAPKANLDESRLYQSLARRGRWGLKVQSLANKVDMAALEVGAVLYSNATVRVAIAFYLIFMHVWVFYVVTSTVHMLPHLPESVHDHHHVFHDDGSGSG